MSLLFDVRITVGFQNFYRDNSRHYRAGVESKRKLCVKKMHWMCSSFSVNMISVWSGMAEKYVPIREALIDQGVLKTQLYAPNPKLDSFLLFEVG